MHDVEYNLAMTLSRYILFFSFSSSTLCDSSVKERSSVVTILHYIDDDDDEDVIMCRSHFFSDITTNEGFWQR